MATAALPAPVTPAAICRTCGGDACLTSLELVNGREVDVTEPCPDCNDTSDAYDDRESETAADRQFADMQQDQHERYLAAFGTTFMESL